MTLWNIQLTNLPVTVSLIYRVIFTLYYFHPVLFLSFYTFNQSSPYQHGWPKKEINGENLLKTRFSLGEMEIEDGCASDQKNIKEKNLSSLKFPHWWWRQKTGKNNTGPIWIWECPTVKLLGHWSMKLEINHLPISNQLTHGLGAYK